MEQITDKEVLLKAADALEQRGHAKFRLVDGDGKMCIAGAINSVQGEHRPEIWPYPDRSYDLLQLVGNKVLGPKATAPDVIHWNNQRERTGAEVVQALRDTAEAL